jgi:hypothetical protein
MIEYKVQKKNNFKYFLHYILYNDDYDDAVYINKPPYRFYTDHSSNHHHLNKIEISIASTYHIVVLIGYLFCRRLNR